MCLLRSIAGEAGHSMPVSPTVRRRRLAADLRLLRENAGLTIDEAAAAADISKSALSRIENALVAAKSPVVRALIHAYGIPDAKAQSLLGLARDAGKPGWWASYSDVLSATSSAYIGFETEAFAIRIYEVALVPGILQTRAYAEALFRTYESVTIQDIDRKVDARVKRQERVAELDLWFILEEGVLRRPVGGLGAHKEQLKSLLASSELSNVTLQILPDSVGAHVGFEGAFSVLEFPDDNDSDIGYCESQAGVIWLEKAEDMNRLNRIFNQLRAAALSASESQSIIRRYVREAE
jgi:transcriptional regulator with XRE-family HTH domain